MRSFDPIAAAIDWLDAYRSCSLSIVDAYANTAVIECGCAGEMTLTGRGATEYWRQRFLQRPVGMLDDVEMYGDVVVLSYSVPHGAVQAALKFDEAGLIVRTQCGPLRPQAQQSFS